MTDAEQIKALAELDGFKREICDDSIEISVFRRADWMDGRQVIATCLPNYPTSFDAIIPLIQKQEHSIRQWIWNRFFKFQFTPAKLCEALLRATGK